VVATRTEIAKLIEMVTMHEMVMLRETVTLFEQVMPVTQAIFAATVMLLQRRLTKTAVIDDTRKRPHLGVPWEHRCRVSCLGEGLRKVIPKTQMYSCLRIC
jgi:hypothetical protein